MRAFVTRDSGDGELVDEISIAVHTAPSGTACAAVRALVLKTLVDSALKQDRHLAAQLAVRACSGCCGTFSNGGNSGKSSLRAHLPGSICLPALVAADRGLVVAGTAEGGWRVNMMAVAS